MSRPRGSRGVADAVAVAVAVAVDVAEEPHPACGGRPVCRDGETGAREIAGRPGARGPGRPSGHATFGGPRRPRSRARRARSLVRDTGARHALDLSRREVLVPHPKPSRASDLWTERDVRATLASAWRALRRGDPAGALRLAEGVPGGVADVLRARALGRAGDVEAARAALDRSRLHPSSDACLNTLEVGAHDPLAWRSTRAVPGLDLDLWILDDEPMVCRAYARIFREYGARTWTTGDDRALFRRLEVERPDVVISDNCRPCFDALDALAGLRRLAPGVAHVIASASFSPRGYAEAICRWGVDGVVSKGGLDDLPYLISALRDVEVRRGAKGTRPR
ncbi:MAG: response regulator [Myxococcales bacterium]|nr:response regulator [Myxococcales bacterium]